MEITKIIILAAVTESVTEYLFSEIPLFEKYIKKLSMLVGIAIAIGFQVDMFPILGVTTVYPIVGQVFTGVLISRGANLFNDLLVTASDGLKKVRG